MKHILLFIWKYLFIKSLLKGIGVILSLTFFFFVYFTKTLFYFLWNFSLPSWSWVSAMNLSTNDLFTCIFYDENIKMTVKRILELDMIGDIECRDVEEWNKIKKGIEIGKENN